MTSLSQYMRAERADVTEPASFYVPGCESWADYGARRKFMGMHGNGIGAKDTDDEPLLRERTLDTDRDIDAEH